MIKAIVILGLVGAIQAGAPVSYSAGLAAGTQLAYGFGPNYQFGYTVSDGAFGDHKWQAEARNGDSVEGQYSLIEPNGFLRTVTYTADPLNGFKAKVKLTPPEEARAVLAAKGFPIA